MRVALVIALAACGDNLTTDMHSGSRLKLLRYELGDGSEAIARDVFHDRRRNEDCSIVRFSSGERHCMPVAAGGATVFTESTCHGQLGAATSAEPPTYFIRSFLLTGTALPSRLYRSGEITTPPEWIWKQVDQYCLGPFPPDPLATYFKLGDEVGPGELVRIRSTETLREDRLALALDETDDGWRMPGTYTDDVAGPCTLDDGPNAERVSCLPSLRATLFADPECGTPLAREEIAAHRDLASGCWSLLEPGEPYNGPTYERIGETCVEVSAMQPPRHAAAVREPATLERTRIHSADTRLEAIELGTLALDVSLHDGQLGADCRVEMRADGTFACVPRSSTHALTYFSDPTCATTIEVAFVPTGSCERPYRYADDRPIGDVYPGTIYELTTGDRCAAYVPPARFAVHVVGEPTTDVVAAVRRVD